jgi:hypothetical protein
MVFAFEVSAPSVKIRHTARPFRLWTWHQAPSEGDKPDLHVYKTSQARDAAKESHLSMGCWVLAFDWPANPDPADRIADPKALLDADYRQELKHLSGLGMRGLRRHKESIEIRGDCAYWAGEHFADRRDGIWYVRTGAAA